MSSFKKNIFIFTKMKLVIILYVKNNKEKKNNF